MTLSRRELCRLAGWLPLAPLACRLRPLHDPTGVSGRLLNDIHSQLNPSRVDEVVPVADLADLRRLVRRAGRRGKAISIAGGRHSMGGQQFGAGTIHADTRRLDRVLDFDPADGLVRVQAGIQWPQLIDWYLEAQDGESRQWGITQKQTGADRLSIGGAVSANAHGRGLALPPMAAEVVSLELVDAEGELRHLGAEQGAELFSLVLGGYGLFGLIYAVTLRLAPRRKLRRTVEIRSADELSETFQHRIDEGYLYGDFQFAVDPGSPDFLHRGVFSCYRPVAPETPMPEEQRRLRSHDWRQLLFLAHTDKGEAFRRYADYYLTTDGQLYWSDLHQLSDYDDGYHRVLDQRLEASVAGTEMISEVYVPLERLLDFLGETAERLRARAANVVYGTIRIVEPDRTTFLPWARDRYACIVLNLHVPHSNAGIQRAREDFRCLIDLALDRGGSYFLTYHRWARPDQVLTAYPQLPDFLLLKRKHDPEERFQSDWYRYYRQMFADRL